MRTCSGCAHGLDHCHGTLVVHVDGGLECTAMRCDDTDPARHPMVVDCAALAFDCCVPVGVVVRAS